MGPMQNDRPKVARARPYAGALSVMNNQFDTINNQSFIAITTEVN